MLAAPALSRALDALVGVPFQGALCRALRAEVLYAFQKGSVYTPRPLYSLGAPASGARFTPKGGAAALYLAEDYVTALHEYLGVGRHAKLKPKTGAGALVTYNVEVKLRNVLDVTHAGVQRVLGTSPKELASAWRFRVSGKKPPTQVLGAAVAKAGAFDAIRFQSTKGTGACVVIFTGLVRAPGYVRIFDPGSNLVGELPSPRAKTSP